MVRSTRAFLEISSKHSINNKQAMLWMSFLQTTRISMVAFDIAEKILES